MEIWRKQLKICCQVLSSSNQLQNRSFLVVDKTRTASKWTKLTWKEWNTTFSLLNLQICDVFVMVFGLKVRAFKAIPASSTCPLRKHSFGSSRNLLFTTNAVIRKEEKKERRRLALNMRTYILTSMTRRPSRTTKGSVTKFSHLKYCDLLKKPRQPSCLLFVNETGNIVKLPLLRRTVFVGSNKDSRGNNSETFLVLEFVSFKVSVEQFSFS